MTKWHHAYIQNSYLELQTGITQQQLDVLGIETTGKDVLDVGCGPGHHLVALSAGKPKRLVGIDTDQQFLTVGRAKIHEHIAYPATCPSLMCAALPHLPFADATFDLVTCFLVLPHVPEDTTAVAELVRVLKPGGMLALSGHGFGFPLRYLKRMRVKPLQMYLASVLYTCTGKKWIRNTLQNDKILCKMLKYIGMTVDTVHYNKTVFGCVSTYWIGATKGF